MSPRRKPGALVRAAEPEVLGADLRAHEPRPDDDLDEMVAALVRAGTSGNTARAYRSAWRGFELWCADRGEVSLPAHHRTIARYITSRFAEGIKPSTVGLALSAIKKAHKLARLDPQVDHPEVREALAGAKRVVGKKQEGKAALTLALLRQISEAMPANLQGQRDRALLLVGFAMGARRSELVGIDVEHLAFVDENEEDAGGVRIFLPRTKTDQEGEGRYVNLRRGSDKSFCPVRALEAWLAAGRIETGPVFRSFELDGELSDRRLSAEHVRIVVKRGVSDLGLDSGPYGAHSLRAGFVTEAYANGMRTEEIREFTDHKSEDMVRRYIRPNKKLSDTPTLF